MAFGFGATIYHRVRRLRIQQEYARIGADIPLNRVRIMDDQDDSSESEQEVMNVTQSTNATQSTNVTQSTLAVPPSEGSSMSFANPGYRPTSGGTPNTTADSSTDFGSSYSTANGDSDATIVETPTPTPGPSNQSQEPSSSTQQVQAEIHPVSPIQPPPTPGPSNQSQEPSSSTQQVQPEIHPVSPIQPPQVEVRPEEPRASTPVATAPPRPGRSAERSGARRRLTSQPEPQRTQPSRKAKENKNYKE